MRVHAVWVAALLASPGLAGAQVAYGGSSTLAETVLQGGAIKGLTARSGVKVQIVDLSGTGKGLEALAQGKLDVVGAGRVLSADERRAGLFGTIIGYDGLAVFVNRSNPVKDLSKEQLKALYTGRVRSWRELGGKDVKVTPMIEPIASKRATMELVQELVNDGAPFVAGIREIDQLRDQLAEVARSEGAICVASIGFLASADPSVRANVRAILLDDTEPSDANIRSGAYPLSRPVLLVTRGAPIGQVRALIEFLLSRDGQSLVEKYFVPVKR
jgi:phosphate transport system substrate-binding protein